MKNLIALTFSFLLSFSALAATQRILMIDYLATDMENVFEIKTDKFDKVILDCQSFDKTLAFIKNSDVVHNFNFDDYSCMGLNEYLETSKRNNVEICFEIDGYSGMEIFESNPGECE